VFTDLNARTSLPEPGTKLAVVPALETNRLVAAVPERETKLSFVRLRSDTIFDPWLELAPPPRIETKVVIGLIPSCSSLQTCSQAL
jgi:hypothetical protein